MASFGFGFCTHPEGKGGGGDILGVGGSKMTSDGGRKEEDRGG